MSNACAAWATITDSIKTGFTRSTGSAIDDVMSGGGETHARFYDVLREEKTRREA